MPSEPKTAKPRSVSSIGYRRLYYCWLYGGYFLTVSVLILALALDFFDLGAVPSSSNFQSSAYRLYGSHNHSIRPWVPATTDPLLQLGLFHGGLTLCFVLHLLNHCKLRSRKIGCVVLVLGSGCLVFQATLGAYDRGFVARDGTGLHATKNYKKYVVRLDTLERTAAGASFSFLRKEKDAPAAVLSEDLKDQNFFSASEIERVLDEALAVHEAAMVTRSLPLFVVQFACVMYLLFRVYRGMRKMEAEGGVLENGGGGEVEEEVVENYSSTTGGTTTMNAQGGKKSPPLLVSQKCMLFESGLCVLLSCSSAAWAFGFWRWPRCDKAEYRLLDEYDEGGRWRRSYSGPLPDPVMSTNRDPIVGKVLSQALLDGATAVLLTTLFLAQRCCGRGGRGGGSRCLFVFSAFVLLAVLVLLGFAAADGRLHLEKIRPRTTRQTCRSGFGQHSRSCLFAWKGG
eukprot:g4518.t1